MANHKSAEKRIRQTKTRTDRNKVGRTKARKIIKSMREAIQTGDKAKATELLTKVQSRLAVSARAGAIQKAAASRTTARLAKQVAALS